MIYNFLLPANVHCAVLSFLFQGHMSTDRSLQVVYGCTIHNHDICNHSGDAITSMKTKPRCLQSAEPFQERHSTTNNIEQNITEDYEPIVNVKDVKEISVCQYVTCSRGSV